MGSAKRCLNEIFRKCITTGNARTLCYCPSSGSIAEWLSRQWGGITVATNFTKIPQSAQKLLGGSNKGWGRAQKHGDTRHVNEESKLKVQYSSKRPNSICLLVIQEAGVPENGRHANSETIPTIRPASGSGYIRIINLQCTVVQLL